MTQPFNASGLSSNLYRLRIGAVAIAMPVATATPTRFRCYYSSLTTPLGVFRIRYDITLHRVGYTSDAGEYYHKTVPRTCVKHCGRRGLPFLPMCRLHWGHGAVSLLIADVFGIRVWPQFRQKHHPNYQSAKQMFGGVALTREVTPIHIAKVWGHIHAHTSTLRNPHSGMACP